MMPVIILLNVLQTNLEKFLKFYFWKKKCVNMDRRLDRL